MSALHQWPKQERPREKLIRDGSQTLSDAELLSIFLRTGLPGQNVVELSRTLLKSFGGLRPLLHADQEQFCQHKGLGLAKYAQLQATLEMAKRHLYEALTTGQTISNPNAAAQYLCQALGHYRQEVIAVLLLDAKNRVLHFELLSEGSASIAHFSNRQLVALAIRHHASGVILAHNHPSGDASPSHRDKQTTAHVKTLLSELDIDLLDHVIVGSRHYYSFTQKQVLPNSIK